METFQQAAVCRGLCKDVLEAEHCFEDATLLSSPSQLRSLFVVLTLQGYQTRSLFDNEKYFALMVSDIFARNANDRKNLLLTELSRKLAEENKTLSDFGFPEPETFDSELKRERMKYDAEEQKLLYDSLCRESPHTPDQEIAFNYIKDAIDSKTGGLIFIQGQGGSGKSTLLKKIMAYARMKDLIALGSSVFYH